MTLRWRQPGRGELGGSKGERGGGVRAWAGGWWKGGGGGTADERRLDHWLGSPRSCVFFITVSQPRLPPWDTTAWRSPQLATVAAREAGRVWLHGPRTSRNAVPISGNFRTTTTWKWPDHESSSRGPLFRGPCGLRSGPYRSWRSRILILHHPGAASGRLLSWRVGLVVSSVYRFVVAFCVSHLVQFV